MPDAAYFLSEYKKKNGQWATWISGEVMLGEKLSQNPVFRACVDREHPEDIYLPFLREYQWIESANENLFPQVFKDAASAPSECKLLEEDEITVVLYMVESFRPDHTPFAGYTRNTLPNLYGLNREHMIFLPHMRSFGTHTRESLYGMLSDADERERVAKHTSFPSILRKHGFHSILIENCTDTAEVTSIPIFRSLLKNSCDDHVIVAKDNDFASLTRKHFATHRRNVCVIYDGYGHHPYDNESGTVWGSKLVDLYDESRLTIDKAAHRFISSLQNMTAIVLICSDHGESFGEGGRWSHGSTLDAEEQRHSFALIWYSDAYARRFPEIVQNLRDNAEAFNSHDQIFHTMPSLGGIHSALRDPAMDMTKRHQGTQNAGQEE